MSTGFPSALHDLATFDIYELSGDTIDFEPYQQFMSPEETSDWIRAWTGNDELTGDEYLIFGQDGTGGYAAFWKTDRNQAVETCPVVFFGSEGELGVVASDLTSFLWLMAQGIGPYEAIEYGATEARDIPALVDLANKYAPGQKRSPDEIISEAQRRHPDFKTMIEALIR